MRSGTSPDQAILAILNLLISDDAPCMESGKIAKLFRDTQTMGYHCCLV